MDKPLSGLHKLSVEQRRKVLNGVWGLGLEAQWRLYDSSLDLEDIGENPIGTYELPLRVAPNILVNGKEYHVPLATEEQSVVAGLSDAAKVAYKSGGVTSRVEKSYVLGHMLLPDLKKPHKVADTINEEAASMAEEMNGKQKHARVTKIRAHAYMPRSSKVSRPDALRNSVIVDVYFDPADAMGAAKASELTEKLGRELYERTGSEPIGKVVSNASGRLTRANVKIPYPFLERKTDERTWKGEDVAKRIEMLSFWAEDYKERAATHNKGAMNGIDALATVTAQDTRAIEAAAHSRSVFDYEPVSRWRRNGDALEGELRVLLPLGTVGGELKRYPKARTIIEDVLKIQSANELAEVAAALGLLQNFAALRMLATEGVTRGHGRHR